MVLPANRLQATVWQNPPGLYEIFFLVDPVS